MNREISRRGYGDTASGPVSRPDISPLTRLSQEDLRQHIEDLADAGGYDEALPLTRSLRPELRARTLVTIGSILCHEGREDDTPRNVFAMALEAVGRVTRRDKAEERQVKRELRELVAYGQVECSFFDDAEGTAGLMTQDDKSEPAFSAQTDLVRDIEHERLRANTVSGNQNS